MIIKLNPYLSDRIWGGSYIKEKLAYKASDTCGEAWGISAVKGMESTVVEGPYKGKTLLQLFQEEKELFGEYPGDEFPILVKIIDASANLSIQVHPDNEYAKKHHNSLGKNESWFILDALPNTKIIVGHKASSKEELTSLVEEKKYDELLNTFDIEKGQMFDIPAGTVHAICKGTVILEVQQSSNLTYRFYDYDRLENGQPRELHVKQALDVIEVPSREITHKGSNEYFTFDIINRENSTHISHKYGDYIYIIEGTGIIQDKIVEKGDFIFIPSNTNYDIKGSLKIGHMTLK